MAGQGGAGRVGGSLRGAVARCLSGKFSGHMSSSACILAIVYGPSAISFILGMSLPSWVRLAVNARTSCAGQPLQQAILFCNREIDLRVSAVAAKAARRSGIKSAQSSDFVALPDFPEVVVPAIAQSQLRELTSGDLTIWVVAVSSRRSAVTITRRGELTEDLISHSVSMLSRTRSRARLLALRPWRLVNAFWSTVSRLKVI